MKKHLYNFFINSLPFIVSLVPSVIAIPLYLKYLGASQLGVYYLYITLIGVGSAFDLGISQTLIKYIAFYKNKSLYFVQQITDSSRSVVLLLICFCASIYTLYLLTAFLFSSKIDYTVYGLFFLGFACQFFLNFELSIFRGHEKFNIVAIYEIIQKMAFTVFGLLLVYLFNKVDFLLLSHIVVTLILLVYVNVKNKLVISNLTSSLALKIGFFRRFLYQYSKWVFIQNLTGFLNGNIDKFIVATYVNVGALASYNTSQNLTGLFQGFTSKGMAYLLPYASKIDDREELRKIFIKGNYILSVILGFVYVIAAIIGPTVIRWYLKTDLSVAELVITYFDILLISSLFSCTALFSWHLFNGMGEIKTNTTIPLFFNVLSIILMLVFGMLYGVWGILYAKLGSVIFSLLVRTLSYNKIFGKRDFLIGLKLASPLIILIILVELFKLKFNG